MTEAGTEALPPPGPDDGASVSRVSKENLLYLPGKLAFAVMAVVAVPVYTHIFSVEDLGRFDLALRFSQLVWTLCVLWLSNVILRFYPVFQLQGQGGAFLALIGWLRRAAADNKT